MTASVDSLHFLHPVHIGELIMVRASVNRVFRTSMEVGVKVMTENLLTGAAASHLLRLSDVCGVGQARGGRFRVPPVIPETEEEKRRFEQAGERRAYRLATRDRLKNSGVKPTPCTCT